MALELSGVNTEEMAQKCVDAMKTATGNLKCLNIMVIGKSGAGKSTLINSVFRENLCETGEGRAVTSIIAQKKKPGFPLTIYDTPGLELAMKQQRDVRKEVFDQIRDLVKTGDLNQAIHCIWYCVNAESSRFDEEESRLLRELTDENRETKVPIIVVLTKSIQKNSAQALKKAIQQENLNVVGIVPVLAQDAEIDEVYIKPAFGLDTLIEVMQNCLPKELGATLQNVQKANLKSKINFSHGIVTAAAMGAFVTGFTPIPFSDAAILAPDQVAMIGSITAAFGVNLSKSAMAALLSSALGAGGATVLGKTIVSNLLKLIPGVGTAAGGVISGTTAFALTAALGEAYILLMTELYKGELKVEDLTGRKGRDEMNRLFKRELKKDRSSEIPKGIQ